MSLHLMFDQENSTTNVITGSSAELCHSIDISADRRRVERGDIEFVCNISAYTSGNFVFTLVAADNAALTTNAVVYGTYRTLAATGTVVIPVPQDIVDKDHIGVLTTAVAHAGTVITHVQSTQMRNRGR